MAGFGGGASSTGNMADSAVSDAKQMAKTAADVYNAGREAQKDAKAVSKAAGQIASGNYVGAVTTAIKNPKTTFKIILVALVLFMIPFFITMMGVIFVVQLPGSIAESVQSAVGQSVDSVTLGWEDFKARLSAGVDDLRECGFQFIKRVRHPHMQPHIGLRGQQIRLFEVDGRGSVSCVLLVDVIASGIFD